MDGVTTHTVSFLLPLVLALEDFRHTITGALIKHKVSASSALLLLLPPSSAHVVPKKQLFLCPEGTTKEEVVKDLTRLTVN